MSGTQQKQLFAGCSHGPDLLNFTYTMMIAQAKSYGKKLYHDSQTKG